MSQCLIAADDDPVIREVYQYVLGDAGYDVTVVRNGRQVLAALHTLTPDLILLDIKMPDLSGWEVLEVIRTTPEWQDIPVVMVSALPEPPSDNVDASRRYDCYVTKKKTGNELLVLVDQALKGTLTTAPQATLDSR